MRAHRGSWWCGRSATPTDPRAAAAALRDALPDPPGDDRAGLEPAASAARRHRRLSPATAPRCNADTPAAGQRTRRSGASLKPLRRASARRRSRSGPSRPGAGAGERHRDGGGLRHRARLRAATRGRRSPGHCWSPPSSPHSPSACGGRATAPCSGMQTLLAITIVFCSVGLVTATSLWAAVLLVLMIAAAGTLFWFLIKAMARIQMPERPGARSRVDRVSPRDGGEQVRLHRDRLGAGRLRGRHPRRPAGHEDRRGREGQRGRALPQRGLHPGEGRCCAWPT